MAPSLVCCLLLLLDTVFDFLQSKRLTLLLYHEKNYFNNTPFSNEWQAICSPFNHSPIICMRLKSKIGQVLTWAIPTIKQWENYSKKDGGKERLEEKRKESKSEREKTARSKEIRLFNVARLHV